MSPQGTVQLGFVIDLGPDVRPGIELAADVRVAVGEGAWSPAMGAVGRVGWRRGAGLTGGVSARGGAVVASGCVGSTHIVTPGVEGEVGIELTQRLPRAWIVGADLTYGSLWFGLQGTTRLTLRVDADGVDAAQLAHDAGRVLVYPECGWELL